MITEKKVLIITKTLQPDSGWGRYSNETIKVIKANDFQVVVAATDHTGDFQFCTGSFRQILKALIKIRRAANTCDIVHAYDGWPYGWLGYMAVIGTAKKLFINGVGTYSVAPLYQPIKGWLLKLAYKRAEAIFCISQYVKKQIDQTGKFATKVVHLGLTRLSLSTDEASILRDLDIEPATYPLILSVGEVKARKGQVCTFEALIKLKTKYPNFLYVVVGQVGEDNNYAKRLLALADKNNCQTNLKIISDLKSDQALSALYQRADLLALNSVTDHRTHHFEGFGLVILEANQFGTPAVGSRDCGIEDAISEGVNGYLADQQNIESIEEAIEKTLGTGKDFWREKTQAWANNFTWKKTGRIYGEAYQGGVDF